MNGTAIEFEARIENNAIRIPEAYRDAAARFSAPIFITLQRASKTLPYQNKKQFSANDVLPPCISTSGWKFNREEAHERTSHQRILQHVHKKE
ncbi:MAG: hypothetical protein LBR16_08125 [Treponema sp.]|nr:hypothetical protein [Treponema sp.]